MSLIQRHHLHHLLHADVGLPCGWDFVSHRYGDGGDTEKKKKKKKKPKAGVKQVR